MTTADRSTESIIAVRDFTKRYGDFTAIDDITFDVARGEIFGLLAVVPYAAGIVAFL